MLEEFRDELDFDARAEGNLRDPEGAAGARAAFAEDLNEQFGSAKQWTFYKRDEAQIGKIKRQFLDKV